MQKSWRGLRPQPNQPNQITVAASCGKGFAKSGRTALLCFGPKGQQFRKPGPAGQGNRHQTIVQAQRVGSSSQLHAEWSSEFFSAKQRPQRFLNKGTPPTVNVKLGCRGVVFWFRSVLKTCRSRLVALLSTPWHGGNEYAVCATKADRNWQVRIWELSEGTGCHGW